MLWRGGCVIGRGKGGVAVSRNIDVCQQEARTGEGEGEGESECIIR